MKIDFAKLGMPVFTGRDRGAEARKQLKLDSIKDGEIVTIIIPEDTYTVTSSYFLGLFGNSVRTLGRDKFIETFKFEAPKHIVVKLDDWISRAIREQTGLV